MWRIMKMNLKEWPFMLVGVIFAAVAGAMPVAFAIILSEVLEVSSSWCDHFKKLELFGTS